ncbi:hypothetical protein OHB41_48810 [Streptomyces sp. NBC_01571]|uniref:hypothetical protein n=1 Tax=Streptomyces sp. NBC_01571 TaxID=2975883 RepID=UPI0022530E37|nr:hypothetical protein [Streptomyces sp. NBC_01571]MCX4580871.1 hypothetical protein [Streptomyces sp. NBC_01571]
MKDVVIRRWAVGAAGMVLGLGAVGCGAEKDGGSTADHAPGAEIAARTASAATPTPKSPTQRPLTQGQLGRAVVDERDLPAWTVSRLGAGTDGFGDGTVRALHEEAAHPVSCAPVGSAVAGGASRYAPLGSVTRMAQSKERASTMELVSYRAADAGRVMDELRSALATCTAYTMKWPTDTTFEDVRRTGDPHQGDEGVSFQLDVVSSSPAVDGDPVRTLQSFQVIRSGSTVAVFSAFNTRAHRIEEVPTALVTAQMKVLETGGHRP